jgi:hypothetical protein
MRSQAALRSIKVLHTVVWAVMAAAIVAIPVATYAGRLRWAGALSALVMVEVIVLTLNRMRCPLTGVAGRYTTDRRANFDIYLPLWLATWNKQVFGTLYAIGLVYAVVRWSGQ